MMLGLGYLGMMSFFIKKQEGRADRYDSILGQRPHETQHPLSAMLRKHRNKIIDAINEIKQPAVILDRDHIVTHWNKAIERLTDVPAKEVIGTRRHWHPFYPHERLVLADLVLENYSHKTIGRLYDHHYQKLAGIPNAYEAALFSPNLSGGGKWLSAAAAPLHDQNGDVQGVIELLEDHTESTDAAMHFDLMKRIARAEWDTLLFFYGVILCVGGLAQFGYLSIVSKYMYTDLGATTANILVGILSSIIDNIPVMFAVLTMDPTMDLGQWLLVTLTAGTGGSTLAIGSAAGVALMGAARGTYTFGEHLKWTPVIALGYVLSILSLLVIQSMM